MYTPVSWVSVLLVIFRYSAAYICERQKLFEMLTFQLRLLQSFKHTSESDTTVVR